MPYQIAPTTSRMTNNGTAVAKTVLGARFRNPESLADARSEQNRNGKWAIYAQSSLTVDP